MTTMATNLDCLKRRDILSRADNSAPDKLIQIGRDYAGDGYLSDAADFFMAAGDEDALMELRSRAVAEGDLFIFDKINKALGRSFDAAALEALADAALGLGKARFAEQAHNRLEPESEEPATGAGE